MRVYVATKEGTVVVDDLPQEATGRDLTTRVLASASIDGGQTSEVARHYLVRVPWPLCSYSGLGNREPESAVLKCDYKHIEIQLSLRDELWMYALYRLAPVPSVNMC